MDKKYVFLNGYLEEEVYIKQPLRYVKKGHEDEMLKVNKAPYDLKQAPIAWNSRINKYLLKFDFTSYTYEHALYIKFRNNDDLLFVCLYVDDLFFTWNNPKRFEDFKMNTVNVFEMTSGGFMSYFLRIKVKQINSKIFISQERYVREVLKKFNMEGYNLVNSSIESGIKLSCYDNMDKANPTINKNLVGNLRYLTHIRLDSLNGARIVNQ